MTDRTVLVAGGGVAGLALARALHSREVPALVLVRRSAAADAGLAVNLPGNAVQALAALGLAEALQGLGAPVRRRDYRDQRGRLLFCVDEADFWGGQTTPRCLLRSDLLDLLGRDLPPGTVRQERGVAAVRQDPSVVEADLSDGSTVAARVLVGADGVHSTVRRVAVTDRAPSTSSLASASWRFMAPDPGVGCWTAWAGAQGTFLLIPVGQGRVYGWAAVSVRRPVPADPRALLDVFGDFPRPVVQTLTAALAQPEPLLLSPLQDVRVPCWSNGRVVLTGDAAHAQAPVWAQGAALAMEDALVLAGLLAQPGVAWETVGREYERRRRPRVTHVQRSTDRMSRATRLPTRLRGTLLPVLGPRSYRATYGPLRTPVAV